MDNMINWAEDYQEGGGLPQPEEPQGLNQHRDNSQMILFRVANEELKRTSLRTLYRIFPANNSENVVTVETISTSKQMELK